MAQVIKTTKKIRDNRPRSRTKTTTKKVVKQTAKKK